MKKIAVLHHTSIDLPLEIDYNQSFAGYTHLLNFKSEIPQSDFISFIYFNKVLFYFDSKRCAPWIYFKWLSIIIRIPFCVYICIKYDKLIIYHSKGFYFYFPVFIFFKSKIIIQVNEIYSNVSGNRLALYLENKYIRFFQKLIVTNINLKQKWFSDKDVLLRGGYFRFPMINSFEKNEKQSYIYTGSVDDYKMGNLGILLNLIESIPTYINLYLCLLISDVDFLRIQNSVDKKENIFLFRNVRDADLNKLFSNCNYGLVLQNPDKPFNLTSFPSKIFLYINNGLIPIAQKNQSFINSEISELFGFIEKWKWEEIIKLDSKPFTTNIIAQKLKKDLQNFISQPMKAHE